MSDNKYLSLDGFIIYNEKIKDYISNQINSNDDRLIKNGRIESQTYSFTIDYSSVYVAIARDWVATTNDNVSMYILSNVTGKYQTATKIVTGAYAGSWTISGDTATYTAYNHDGTLLFIYKLV